tara:strand:- start:2548 stop:3933 length:1386 start_codon:yes stop_codon:yes gene_type:complete
MDKGGGIGSMIKGMGGKFKDVGSKMVDKAGNISNKVSEMSETAKTIESTIKEKVNLSDKKDIVKENIDKMKDFDENISEKQAKGRIRDEYFAGKSVVNRYGLFGPDTYKYLIYVILFLNSCCVFLLIFNKTIFYKYQTITKEFNLPVSVRLNKNVFYIYIFTLFLLILQLYTLKENYDAIVEKRGKYQVYVEVFNVLCTIGLTYYIYTQIDFIHTECPEPNKRVCVANNNNTNQISTCPKGPFKCGNIEFKEYDCKQSNCDNDIANNFYLIPPPPPPPPPNTCANFDPSLCTDPSIPYNASGVCISASCTVSDCCAESTNERTDKYFTDLFDRLIKGDEDRITALEDRINNLSPGAGIPGPPGPSGPAGPAGPPGTPGSDPRPSIPPSNQFENILCPNEPGGICKDGQTRCNDQGMCEGFALISLRDKIDLKLKYKDLNSNSYKANNLMNNLENFLLNTLK